MRMHYVLAWLWTSILIVLSVISKSNARKLSFIDFFGIDKVAHFGFYAILTILWSYAFNQSKIRGPKLKSFFMAVTLGACLEFVQKYWSEGRSFEYDDMIANTLGALMGLIVYQFISTKFDAR